MYIASRFEKTFLKSPLLEMESYTIFQAHGRLVKLTPSFHTQKGLLKPQSWNYVGFSSVQLLSRVQLFATPWTAACQASLSSSTPGVYSNSCPLSWWYHPTISSSVVPFSSCLQSCPASGSFQMSQFFTSSGQSTGVSASASVLPMNIQDWFPLGWTGWISLQSKGPSRVFSNTTSKASILQCSAFFIVQVSHPHITTGKTTALTKRIFVGNIMSLLFNMLSRFVITFLLRIKCLLISWL